MNTVFIVPTGLGAEIGGHAGDASPAATLIASVSDIMITHPNVYNASDINEMPANVLYVEGSMLDKFLQGQRGLRRVHSNKILVAVNAPVRPETINAVSAARATIGLEAKIVELDTPLKMITSMEHGKASGKVEGWEELIEGIKQFDFDALAIATEIDHDPEMSLKYLRSAGGTNPWGGVEAILSKLVSEKLGRPVAHAPLENPALNMFNEVIDPRKSAEAVSSAYIHCVLKGLHKAPQYGDEIRASDIDCLVTADNCRGKPHFACIDQGIPIIVVRDNPTVGHNVLDPSECIIVENYLEAAGMIAAIKAGISPESLTRPLAATEVIRRVE